jgi:hypothetical protein
MCKYMDCASALLIEVGRSVAGCTDAVKPSLNSTPPAAVASRTNILLFKVRTGAVKPRQ